MSYHRIKYYPVGNGDTSLISLSDKTTIIIDTNLTADSENDEDVTKYDVKADMLTELDQDGGVSFADTFILTHPDQDHIRNFKKHYYVGDPSKLGEEEIEEELIRIDELWFSPKIFDRKDNICDDAEDFRKEARRRMKLHKGSDSSKDLPGNRIVIIGYSDNPELEGLESLILVPGSSTSKINGSEKIDFSLFIHAPFKDDVEDGDDRNDSSIVFQANFKVRDTERAGLALFGGDAGWKIWEKILEKSEDETLEWDLLLAPHHCSWGFFNDSPQADDERIATESSTEILSKSREGAWVISSSRVFQEETPPDKFAKKEYVKEVGDDKFILSAEYPDKKAPKPIVFKIVQGGPQKEPDKKSSGKNSRRVAGGTVSTYG